MPIPDTRVCFLGDSFTLGQGDREGLGWVGRLFAAERARGQALTAYNLGVRGDTGAQIAARALAEVGARIGEGTYRTGVVICFGANDVFQDRPAEESVRAMAGLLHWARGEGHSAFVLGAPPSAEPALEIRLKALQAALAAVCAEQGAPFLDLRAAVVDWSPWHESAAAIDGVHPDAPGYRLIAEAFGAWRPWRGFMDD